MNFRTEINLQKEINSIDYKSNIILIGSCFSDNIGEKFNYFKFKSLINPFGVVYNIVSIEKLITRTLQNSSFTKSDFIFYNEIWQSLDLHSNFSHKYLESAINQANESLKQTRKQLLKASHIIITLGTSWVYKYKKDNTVVANCHKIPQTKFTKTLLSVNDIKESLNKIIKIIKKYNLNINIVLTVSPVRHLKDGFIENSQSKAHLLTAIHQLNKKNTFYFPAYEIMLDDLRDYRFYKNDMLHPNNLAIEYIWNCFKRAWLNKSTDSLIKKIDIIQKGLKHKPFNPDSKKHKDFIKKLKNKIKEIKEKHNIILT